MVFTTAESVLEFLKAATHEESSFTLAIATEFTFHGKPDHMGVAMAAVLDAVLGRGFEPDGFEQRDGFRLYRYKMMLG